MKTRYDSARAVPSEQLAQMLALLNEAFPCTERRADGEQLKLLNNPRYVLDLVTEQGRLVALMAWWRLDGVRFIEHFAVDRAARNGGVGGKMLDGFLGEDVCPAVLEVELPEGETARRRIGFYRRHGFALSERDYAQLPLRAGDSQTPMKLMFYPALPDEAGFDRVRHEIYRYVYNKQE